jgi:uncharacterized phiE125 gp8 family phage protein
MPKHLGFFFVIDKYEMLITRTSTSTFSLIDDDTLREWLRIDSDIDADTLAMLLASATDYIQGLTGSVLAASNYTVAYDRFGCRVDVPLFPLNSITGVTATLADGSSVTLDTSAYTVNLLSYRPSITLVTAPTDAVGLIVSANAGYTAQASVPASLQHAAAVLVAAGYDNRSELAPNTLATVANLIAQYHRVFL